MIKPITPSKTTTPFTSRPIYTSPQPAKVIARKVTHEDIARRAYEIYVEKGCPQDQCQQNWLQAELELRN